MHEDLSKQLTGAGLTAEQIAALEGEGVATAADMAKLSAAEIKSITGCGLVIAKKLVDIFAPVPEVTLGAGAVSEADVPNLAAKFGMDPTMLMGLLFTGLGAGSGLGIDMSAMMPVASIISGYNPKIKDLSYMIMGQIEARLNVGPIIAINADGSVNAEVTVQYVMSVEEGFPSEKDGVFYAEEGAPYELIQVGVDAKSVYDADPLDSSRALRQNGIGIGRIAWKKVPSEVRQMVHFAVSQTGEIDPTNEADLQWLRDNIKPASTRLNLRMKCPQANAAWNEANRTGTLPTLRVQLSVSPRRPSLTPNRRSAIPRDLSDGGGTSGSATFPRRG